MSSVVLVGLRTFRMTGAHEMFRLLSCLKPQGKRPGSYFRAVQAAERLYLADCHA
jgi:hypothetical protein